MPITACTLNGKAGWKWGQKGTCHTGPGAHESAMADGKKAGGKKFGKLAAQFQVLKAEPDQHLVFGWFSVVEKDGQPVVDLQGDIIPEDVLEVAAYDYVLESRQGGDMHKTLSAQLVASVVFTKELQAALGIDLGQVGWFGGFKVHDEEVWQKILAGERPMFSVGGSARGVEVP